jgi:hypothetical protein
MRTTLITFGSIVAILVGAILIYSNVFDGYINDFAYQVGAGIGVILLAAGITGLWMKGPFKRD